MLFWETLRSSRRTPGPLPIEVIQCLRSARLPYDRRCAAQTRQGRRCRGRIRKGSEFCFFHDPEVPPERRRADASKGGRSRRRLSHIPDGYLRKLTDRASVGAAMDRLYREIRLGIVTTEMGKVLFDILCRVLDEQLIRDNDPAQSRTRRTKVGRMRPRLEQLLTPVEQSAWQQAVEDAPEAFVRMTARERKRKPHTGEGEHGRGAALPAAS